jgi:hypothetical protein
LVGETLSFEPKSINFKLKILNYKENSLRAFEVSSFHNKNSLRFKNGIKIKIEQ